MAEERNETGYLSSKSCVMKTVGKRMEFVILFNMSKEDSNHCIRLGITGETPLA